MKIYLASGAPGSEEKKMRDVPRRLLSYHHIIEKMLACHHIFTQILKVNKK